MGQRHARGALHRQVAVVDRSVRPGSIAVLHRLSLARRTGARSNAHGPSHAAEPKPTDGAASGAMPAVDGCATDENRRTAGRDVRASAGICVPALRRPRRRASEDGSRRRDDGVRGGGLHGPSVEARAGGKQGHAAFADMGARVDVTRRSQWGATCEFMNGAQTLSIRISPFEVLAASLRDCARQRTGRARGRFAGAATDGVRRQGHLHMVLAG